MALFKSAAPKQDPKPAIQLAVQHKGEPEMTKPSSYFSIQDQEFITKGRKGNPDKKSVEKALFCEGELFTVAYRPIETVGMKEKHVRESHLKEICEILEGGYDEKITKILLKEKGYKELVQKCDDEKILLLDFCKWVNEEVAKFPVKKRGRQAGEPKATRTKSNPLVSILAGLEPHIPAEQLVETLRKMVVDEDMVNDAISFIELKEHQNGRDSEGYVQLRIRTKKEK